VLQTFTRDSFLTLSAVCERLFPRDVDPGAIDLGVPQFIDRTVHDAEELSGVRALLVRTLPLLDKESERRFGARFHAAKPEDQDQLLESWQHGHDQTARFVALTLSLTLEGVFGDPKYGGNKGGRGFQLLAFAPDPPFVKSSPMPPMGHGAGH
jgi:gluconate 2-dehydrogenase gamma chain